MPTLSTFLDHSLPPDRCLSLRRGHDHQSPQGAPQGQEEGGRQHHPYCYSLIILLLQVKNIQHNGDITMDDIYNAARVLRPRSLGTVFSRFVLICHHYHHKLVNNISLSGSN